MVPNPVYQENVVIDEFYQRACQCDFGKQRNKLHSALERKPCTNLAEIIGPSDKFVPAQLLGTGLCRDSPMSEVHGGMQGTRFKRVPCFGGIFEVSARMVAWMPGPR